MAYVDTPMAAQRIKDTQTQIEQNFIEINNLVSVDHYTFGSPNQGEHMKVTLPDQGIPPVFAGNDIGLWAQIPTTSPLTAVNELFIRRQDGTTSNISGKLALAAQGWSYLPSGILLKWGLALANGVSVVTYTVDPTIPVFQSVLVTFTQIVTPSALDTNDFVNVDVGAGTYLTTSFTVYGGTRTQVGVPTPVAFAFLTIGT
jgi:hypothetical protein